MELAAKPKRFGEHKNAFGFLRLAFAALVVVSHVPETQYGGVTAEPLHRAFGSISFGTLAVYGFFLISGYLITASYLTSSSVKSYFIKRAARIYPAFIVASLICVVAVAPLAGGVPLNSKTAMLGIVNIVTLQPPEAAHVFFGTHYPALNGSMWTISYEFRCYLLVPFFGAIGLLQRQWTIPTAGFLLLILGVLAPPALTNAINTAPHHPGIWLGRAPDTLILAGMFCVGASYYLFRKDIVLTHRLAALSFTLLIMGLLSPVGAPIAVATAGSYLIFYAAQFGGVTPLASVNNSDDVSYGLYLYAWPIGKLMQWYVPTLGVWETVLVTIFTSYGFGYASWLLIEKPVMEWTRGMLRDRSRSGATT
jgi:peptidoglycan/LPS O-acetylase OafA/YrhL